MKTGSSTDRTIMPMQTAMDMEISWTVSQPALSPQAIPAMLPIAMIPIARSIPMHWNIAMVLMMIVMVLLQLIVAAYALVVTLAMKLTVIKTVMVIVLAMH